MSGIIRLTSNYLLKRLAGQSGGFKRFQVDAACSSLSS